MMLAVIIPARMERWLNRTVADVLANASADTGVIVVLDGQWPAEPLAQDPRLTVLYLPQPVGQRAATNLGARLAQALGIPYLMKLDAHCAMAPGFDRVLLDAAATLGSDVVQIPAQKNLHVYDYVCDSCGGRFDQAPKREHCPTCQGALREEVVWQPRASPTTTNWVLDADLKFTYASNKHQRGDICDVMTSLGACVFLSTAYYHQLGGFDEATGSWGQFGQELACKVWLSGGRHVCNRTTWFAHFFRVGGIGFPYPISAAQQERARVYARTVWRGNQWPRQRYPLRWLVEKFWPVPGWTEQDRAALAETLPRPPTAGVIYYSDNRPDPGLLEVCRRQLQHAAGALPIVSCTLQPTDLGRNIVLPLERGYLTMARQILTALEALDTDVVFFCEHDVLYHPSHFDFRPADPEVYYYNEHQWKVDVGDGRAVYYTCRQLSGLCGWRPRLLAHFRERVRRIEAEGYSTRMGFEPGTHRRRERIDDYGSAAWRSAWPNIDLRHPQTLTKTRWSQSEFRDQRHCRDWQEADAVPGWGVTRGRMPAFLQDVVGGRNGDTVAGALDGVPDG